MISIDDIIINRVELVPGVYAWQFHVFGPEWPSKTNTLLVGTSDTPEEALEFVARFVKEHK